jgi:hypothetical protein
MPSLDSMRLRPLSSEAIESSNLVFPLKAATESQSFSGLALSLGANPGMIWVMKITLLGHGGFLLPSSSGSETGEAANTEAVGFPVTGRFP